MRRLVATSVLLACSGLAAGCGLLDEGTSNKVGALESIKGDTFRIKLPCNPEKSEDPVPVPGGDPLTLVTWMCEDGDSAYSISTMTLPPGVKGDLDGAAQGAAAAVDGTVVANKVTTFAGEPARDIRVKASFEGEPATVFTRVVQHGRTFFQVQVALVDSGAKNPPALYQKVLKSLTFK